MSQPNGMEQWDAEAKRGMDMLETIEQLQERVAKLEAALSEQTQKSHNNLMRALRAETQWATFRGLTRDARAIIYRDYPLGTEHSPASVRHFMQRSEEALESQSLEDVDEQRSP